MLKAAVEDALTAEWRRQHPATEPASALLTRILAERRRRWEEEQLRKFAAAGKEPPKNWKAKYEEPVSPDPVDLPTIPDGWAFASMDILTCRITSGSRDWQQYDGDGTGTFVMAQNVRPGHLDMTCRQAVNPPPDDPSCERSRVECNDLLVTIVGANTGDVCRVPDPLPEQTTASATRRRARAAFCKVRRNLLQKCRVHTLLRLPTGIWYSPGVKANVIFFDKMEGRAEAWTDRLWVYDLRTNLHFTLKQSPIPRKDFDEFVSCYKPGKVHERKATWSEENPEGRWRSFKYEELLKRDKLSLDLFWIKDKSLTDTDSLPTPEILAQELADDLETALEQSTKIAAKLARKETA